MGLNLGGGVIVGGDVIADGPLDPLRTLKLWCIGGSLMEGDINYGGGILQKWTGTLRNQLWINSTADTYTWSFVGSSNSYAAASGTPPTGWVSTLPSAQAYWDGAGQVGSGSGMPALEGVRSGNFQSWGLGQFQLFNCGVILDGTLDVHHAYAVDSGGSPGAVDASYLTADLVGRILMLAKIAHECGNFCPVVVCNLPPILNKVAAVNYINGLLATACADFSWIIFSDINSVLNVSTDLTDNTNLTAGGYVLAGNKIYADLVANYVTAAGL